MTEPILDAPYLDTSVLLKRYVGEALSGEVDDFLQRFRYAWISRLSIVEFRCALARKRRNNELDEEAERLAVKGFEDDLRDGYFEPLSLDDATFAQARGLIDQLPDTPLRALDALHLAVALHHHIGLVATADRVMARAATHLGLSTQPFFSVT
ncbi:MAG: type II toxin-antitoxin system VapC family toxin [Betaproteobacteria bacterium]|nr:type II toxin-antitoxin system VapC family toxin [Betaproteobacteria bacterium]